MDKLYYSTRNIHVFKCSISAQNTFIFFFLHSGDILSETCAFNLSRNMDDITLIQKSKHGRSIYMLVIYVNVCVMVN